MADKEIIATGRRKTSIAVVKLVKGKGRIFVNGKKLTDYIGNRPAIEMLVYRPLVLTDNQDKYDVRVKAVGGGVVAQCGAIRHGIARALVKANEEYRNVLRLEGLLTRDPRVKERKKYRVLKNVKNTVANVQENVSNSQNVNISKKAGFQNRLFILPVT